jgi:hypothetical protein
MRVDSAHVEAEMSSCFVISVVERSIQYPSILRRQHRVDLFYEQIVKNTVFLCLKGARPVFTICLVMSKAHSTWR